MPAPTLTTARLILRPWRDADLAPFARMNADPEVMAQLPGLLTPTQSNALAERIRTAMRTEPFGLWAVQVAGGADFVGYVGLSRPRFDAPFTPCVEVGWRLAREAWGHGYATEAARAAILHGFAAAGLDQIVSFTVPANRRSVAVMRRLGMHRSEADDFDHPALPVGHFLRRHVLYRLHRTATPA
jgi:RimJ/RimL family protein N-acetyltransferase